MGKYSKILKLENKEFNDRLDKSNNKLKMVNDALDSLMGKATNMGGSIQNLTGKLNNMGNVKIKGLEKSSKGLKITQKAALELVTSMLAMQGGFKNGKAYISENAKSLINYSEQITRVTNQLQKLKDDLSDLKKQKKIKISQVKDDIQTNKEINALKRKDKAEKQVLDTQAKSKSNIIKAEELAENKKVVASINNKNKAIVETIDLINKKDRVLRRVKEEESLYRQVKATESLNKALIRNEVTYKSRLSKVIALKSAIRNLARAEGDHANEIKIARKEIKRLNKVQKEEIVTNEAVNNSRKKSVNVLQQLKRQAAIYFGLASLMRFGNQIVKITADYEKQEKTLGILIQDMDKASNIFSKIKKQAVKSPFRVRELVTYTKQMAAYRVEADKLWSTTKKLADVSAGLGVGMDRLILAYGQVKAANYLRGTELRQFSEAGINILGELADKLSNTQHRLVTVGEVMEMVSKRMISFQDVEAVFTKITSDGGIFYNMQEEQSKLLYGRIANLKDAFEQMLDKIGKSQKGVLYSATEGIGYLIENYEEVIPYIKLILGLTVAWKSATLLLNLAQSRYVKTLGLMILNLRKTNNGITETNSKTVLLKKNLGGIKKTAKAVGTGLVGAFTGAAVSAAIGGLIYGIIHVIKKMSLVSDALKSVNEEYSKLGSKGAKALENSLKNIKNLINDIETSSTGSGKRISAIDKLNNSYGKYLGYLIDEKANTEDLKNVYDDLNKALKVNRALKMLEESGRSEEQKYQDTFGEKFEKYIKELDELKSVKGHTYIEQFSYAIDIGREEAVKIIEEYKRERTKQFEEGKATLDDARNLFKNIFEKVTKKDIKGSLLTGTFQSRDFINSIDKSIEFLNKSKESREAQINAITDGGLRISQQVKKELEEVNKELKSQIQDIEKGTGKYSEEILKGVDPEKYEKMYGSKIAKQRRYQQEKEINRLKEQAKKERVEIKVRLGVLGKSDIREWADPTTKDINNRMKKFMSGAGFKEFDFGNRFIDRQMATNKTIMQQNEDLQKQYEGHVTQQKDLLRMKDRGIKYNKDQLDNTKKQIKLDILEARARGIKLSSSGKGGKGALGTLRLQIELIKKAHREYNKLLQEYSQDESFEKVSKGFKSAFSAAGIGFMFDKKYKIKFDTKGTLRNLENLTNIAKQKGKQLIEKSKAPFKAELQLELQIKNRKAFEKKLDDVLGEYNFTKGLKKAGVSEDITEKVFGIDVKSLSDLGLEIENIRKSMFKEDLGETGLKKAMKKYEDSLKKYEGLQKAHLKEMQIRYAKYLQDSKDERLQIKEEYDKSILDIAMMSDQLPPEAQKALVEKSNKKREQKLAEVDWKDFKATDEFQLVFEELERVGTASINSVLSKLDLLSDSLKDKLPLDQYKELMGLLKQIRNESEDRTPFATIGAGFEDISKGKEAMSEAKEAMSKAKEGTEEYTKAQQKLNRAQDNVKRGIYKISKGLNNLKKRYQKVQDSIGQVITAVKEVADAFTSGLGDSTTVVLDSIIQGFQMVGSVIAGVIALEQLMVIVTAELEAMLWPLLLIALALVAVLAVLNINDKKKQKKIDREKDKIDNLKKAYDKLTKAIKNAYDMRELEGKKKDADTNIDQQISSYQKMIAVEKDRKKTDKEKIKQWQNAIEELEDKRAELEEDLRKTKGGVDYKSAAQSFADAWFDAFNQIGDGRKALEDSFDDLWQSLIKKQIMLKVGTKFIKKIFDQFDKAVDESGRGGSFITKEELDDMKKVKDEQMDAYNEYMKRWMEVLGIRPTGGESELSALQRGIQAITEPTGEALEALLNSMRFIAKDSNLQLLNISTNIDSIVNQLDISPLANELRSQTRLLESINDSLESVISPTRSNAGAGIKVFMD